MSLFRNIFTSKPIDCRFLLMILPVNFRLLGQNFDWSAINPKQFSFPVPNVPIWTTRTEVNRYACGYGLHTHFPNTGRIIKGTVIRRPQSFFKWSNLLCLQILKFFIFSFSFKSFKIVTQQFFNFEFEKKHVESPKRLSLRISRTPIYRKFWDFAMRVWKPSDAVNWLYFWL